MRSLLIATILIAAQATAAGAVEFKFAPPDGLECDQHSKIEKSSFLKDTDAPKRDESAETLTHVVYEKKPPGYRVKATARSAEMKRDGQPLADPFTKVMIGRELIMDLDSEGKVTDLHGYDAVIKDLLAALPPETRQQMEKVLTVESFRERETADWKGRVADFVGLEVEQGQVIESDSEFPLPSGALKFKTLTRFSKIENRGGRPMVTIHFAYAADGAGAKAMMERVLKDIAGLNNGLEFKVGEPTVQGGGERVIDASTMTIETETIARTIAMPMDVPGHGKAVMVRTESRTYRNTCKEPGAGSTAAN